MAPHANRDDDIHIQILQQIVRTGQVSIPVEDNTVTPEPSPGINIEDQVRKNTTLCISQSEAPYFATAFGKTFDVGPYVVIIEPREVETRVLDGQPDSRVLRIVLARPLIYQFEKFRRTTPNTRSPDA
jgi:hypothetical protein